VTTHAVAPSIRVPHLLLGGNLACAQAFEAKARELNGVHRGRISQKDLRFAHPPLAFRQ
jgi:hypothetical protein